MRKILLLGAALLTLGAASPVYAAGAGAAAGATTGATLVFVFGGPVGAIVGGFSGAVMGSGVEDASIAYAGTHPVEEIYVTGGLKLGYHVAGKIKVYPIESDDVHGYFYANNRVWIVDLKTGLIVASPGFTVSEKVVAYVKKHPTTSITIKGDLKPGLVLDSGLTFTDVPDAHGYAYIYVDSRPVLLDASSRTVIWVG